MKALEKDRGRRYETANGFAADILRHLAHEPVLAAPPSRAYRLRKFVRKHRVQVIAAVLVVAALLGGVVGTSLGLIRAERARVDLEHQLGVSEFLLAKAAYDDQDVALAAERLDNVPRALRGWEWSYLKRLARGGLYTLGHNRSVCCGVVQPRRHADLHRQLGQIGENLGRSDGHAPNRAEWAHGHRDRLVVQPRQARIVTASDDKTAKVWDARTGEPLLELNGHAVRLLSASFSPDGTRIVTASSDKSAKVWDARTGEPLLELNGHAVRLVSASFSPDGTRIVTASYDKTVKVWDARTGAPLLEFKGHTAALNIASFSPDGTRIVTASMDGTAKVWDARTGEPLLELIGHAARDMSASFSPDGMRIVTASYDMTAKVWDAADGDDPARTQRAHGPGV